MGRQNEHEAAGFRRVAALVARHERRRGRRPPAAGRPQAMSVGRAFVVVARGPVGGRAARAGTVGGEKVHWGGGERAAGSLEARSETQASGRFLNYQL